MAEYIEMEAAFDAITDLAGKASTRSAYEAIWKSARALKKIPAADVAPVVHGQWIPISDGAWAECSECGECYDVSDNGGMAAFELFCDFYKHCPNCGAQMHEDDLCSHGECREDKDEK